MIDNQFLLYQTLDAYRADVNNIKPTSIVFVVEDGTVRTHGFVFDGKCVKQDDLQDYAKKDDLQSYAKQNDLQSYVKKDEIAQYIPEQPIVGGDKKHVFLTQSEYDALEEYDRDTIYFILESAEYTSSQFGGRFPITLS
jgi:hypothetical protein